MSSFSSLPEDTIIDIFSRLPLNYLARVRQVCKCWCSLTTKINGINANPIILFTCPSYPILHALNCNDYSNDSSSSPQTLEVMDYPFMNQQQQQQQSLDGDDSKVFRVLDSCNGLLCVQYRREVDFHVKSHDHGTGNTNINAIYLWNPSTKEFKSVPEEPFECPSGVFSSFRISYIFGCNHTMNDYKLFRTVQYFGGDIHCSKEVKVYTLQTNSWRRINEDTIPTGKPHLIQRQEVHLNGAIHWISNFSSSTLKPLYEIVAFDIKDEKYQVLSKPKHFDDDDDDEMFYTNAEVLVLRGCLCIFYRFKNDMELWMMKDYGVKESWTKLFQTTNSTLDKFWCLKVLWLCKNGKILMTAEENNLFLYEPEKDEAKYLRIDRNHIKNWSHAEIFIDNCMSLES